MITVTVYQRGEKAGQADLTNDQYIDLLKRNRFIEIQRMDIKYAWDKEVTLVAERNGSQEEYKIVINRFSTLTQSELTVVEAEVVDVNVSKLPKDSGQSVQVLLMKPIGEPNETVTVNNLKDFMDLIDQGLETGDAVIVERDYEHANIDYLVFMPGEENA